RIYSTPSHSSASHSPAPQSALIPNPSSTPSIPTAANTALPTPHLASAPTPANNAATPYEQPSKILSASTLLATTAQPRERAAAGTSYSHITIRMGKSFVDEETKR